MNKAHDYRALEREYISSDISIRELCRRHGISAHSLVTIQAKKHGWEEKREQSGRLAGRETPPTRRHGPAGWPRLHRRWGESSAEVWDPETATFSPSMPLPDMQRATSSVSSARPNRSSRSSSTHCPDASPQPKGADEGRVVGRWWPPLGWLAPLSVEGGRVVVWLAAAANHLRQRGEARPSRDGLPR